MILSLVQPPHINKHLISTPEISNLSCNFSLHPITKVHGSQLESLWLILGAYLGLAHTPHLARINHQRPELLRCTCDDCARRILVFFIRVVVFTEFIFKYGANMDYKAEGAKDGEQDNIDTF